MQTIWMPRTLIYFNKNKQIFVLKGTCAERRTITNWTHSSSDGLTILLGAAIRHVESCLKTQLSLLNYSRQSTPIHRRNTLKYFWCEKCAHLWRSDFADASFFRNWSYFVDVRKRVSKFLPAGLKNRTLWGRNEFIQLRLAHRCIHDQLKYVQESFLNRMWFFPP